VHACSSKLDVRTAGPVAGLTAQMQSALASADPTLPFSGFYDMKDLIGCDASATQRIEVALLAAMASLALLLSAVGIFGLVANMVAQRTREIGIRIALGSTLQKVMIHVGRSGVGAASSWIGSRTDPLRWRAPGPCAAFSMAWDVYDLPTILVVVLTLSLVALLATTVPALRIARIDPAKDPA